MNLCDQYKAGSLRTHIHALNNLIGISLIHAFEHNQICMRTKQTHKTVTMLMSTDSCYPYMPVPRLVSDKCLIFFFSIGFCFWFCSSQKWPNFELTNNVYLALSKYDVLIQTIDTFWFPNKWIISSSSADILPI